MEHIILMIFVLRMDKPGLLNLSRDVTSVRVKHIYTLMILLNTAGYYWLMRRLFIESANPTSYAL